MQVNINPFNTKYNFNGIFHSLFWINLKRSVGVNIQKLYPSLSKRKKTVLEGANHRRAAGEYSEMI